MLKRKRSESEQPVADLADDARVDRATAKQRKHLAPKIDQGKKTLTKALKVSRGFERQKLSRRRKAAEKDGKAKDLERIDAEIEALKKIEWQALAESHLYKTLLKIKSVAEHPALPPWIQLPDKPKPDTATMNVQARLFNANPTKEAMNEVLRDIRSILDLDDVKGPKMKKAKGEEEQTRAQKKASAKEQTQIYGSAGSSAEDERSSGEDSEEGNGEDQEWNSEEFAGFSDRIAGSSDSESDQDVSETLKRNYKPVRDLSFTPPSSREASPSPSPDPTFSASESPEPRSKSESRSNAKVSISTDKSTFIPSLSAVGYISGSESEAEDLDGDVAPVRKNRRGQRARQQLWEKKYGEKAKHVQKQKNKEKNDRNAGWDATRGAIDTSKGGRGKGRFDKGAQHDQGASFKKTSGKGTDANAVELGKKKNHRDDQGKLHPSWEAAKLAKEKAKLNAVQFQGKKVVFD